MAQVELSEFVRDVLIEVAQGVRAANDRLKDSGKQQYEVFGLRHNQGDSAEIPGIKFDVAVTATGQQKDKAGFFVALASVGGGANTEKAMGDEKVHRVQFEIGVEHTWR